MKHAPLIFLLLFSFLAAEAKHITGGEVIYNFISSNGSSKTYLITLLLFRDENCDATGNCAEMPTVVRIGIFNRDNNQRFGNFLDISQEHNQLIPTNAVPNCITNPPSLVYRVGYYSFTITLPNNANGYTAAYQTCCRIDGIRNIGNSVGATYTTDIPGTNALSAAARDDSPRFTTGISVVCFNKPFTLDFSATDPDGDQLSYSMCSGYNGGGAVNAQLFDPAAPPYGTLSYTNGFNGISPLGEGASINSQTGIISGVAPDAGKYVVSVCVSSSRNGIYIGTHRKDFIITVAPCDLAGAQLQPNYITCDGFSYSFENLLSSPLNLTSYWDFGDPNSGAANISTSPTPTHTYSDTGIYLLKFVVNRGNSCSDSTLSTVKVFPGYFPGLGNNSPRCKGSAVQFYDSTRTNYGVINSWSWDFGNANSSFDVSNLQNPTYVYSQPGIYIASLTVGSDKGCIGTVTDTVIILARPPFAVTNDTLICSVDDLQLHATATATCCVTWSPNYNISDIHSFDPVVAPDVTTTYSVAYSDDRGCSANETVKVRVVDTVTLKTGKDTIICRSDGISLPLVSDALKYVWTQSPAGSTLNNTTLQNPIATPTAAFTTYYVTGHIGSCVDSDSIKIKTVPYPPANGGPDQTICLGSSTGLSAGGGSSYTWTPTIFLTSPLTANTGVKSPTVSLTYVVTVRDTLGCPKPVNDTVIVHVNRIIADAGPRDTSVVTGQPLQLHATGSSHYAWLGVPSTLWLSNPNIANPVSTPQDDITYIVTASDSIGCFDTDTIAVHFYKVAPDLYIPTAFSPNGDGLNDVLKPLALGLKSVDAFRIFNRWGQLIFSTSEIGMGWDGRFNGNEQSPGTYIWYAEGTDFRNKKIFRKGSVVLIR